MSAASRSRNPNSRSTACSPEAIEIHTHHAFGRQQKLKLDCPLKLEVTGDRAKLMSAISHLITNALRHSARMPPKSASACACRAMKVSSSACATVAKAFPPPSSTCHPQRPRGRRRVFQYRMRRHRPWPLAHQGTRPAPWRPGDDRLHAPSRHRGLDDPADCPRHQRPAAKAQTHSGIGFSATTSTSCDSRAGGEAMPGHARHSWHRPPASRG